MSERETTVQAMADEKTFTLYSSESKWINRITKLSEQYPEEVKITNTYKSDDGFNSITAEIPKNYLKISHPRKINITEERRKELAERMSKARNAKSKESNYGTLGC